MPFYISPRVNVIEKDLTLSIQNISDAIGATVGLSRWGPANVPTLIEEGEDDFITRFYKPDNNTYLDILTACDYMRYTNQFYYTRVVGPLARNASSQNPGLVTVYNEKDYEGKSSELLGINFISRYVGDLGNSLAVSVMDMTGIDTWEYAPLFEYDLQTPDQFSIAIIDTKGMFGGGGERKQEERLSIVGTAAGGTQEKRTITVIGTVAGGIKQAETITIEGTATEAGSLSITTDVAVLSVAVASGDTFDVIASNIADALATDTANFESAVANNGVITLTYAVPGLYSKVSMPDSLGIVLSSVITTPGDDNVLLDIYGRSFGVKNGDGANDVAQVLGDQLSILTTKYESVVVDGSSIALVYKNFGASTDPTDPVIQNGITANIAVDTAGSNGFDIEVFGVTVSLLNGDKANIVANKISVALNADTDYMEDKDLVSPDKSTVLIKYNETGKRDLTPSPEEQGSLVFNMAINVVGTLGTMIDGFEIQTNTPGAKFPDGTSQYFVSTINDKCRYVMVGDQTLPLVKGFYKLSGGADDYNVRKGPAFANYNDKYTYEVNYMWVAGSDVLEQRDMVDAVETRKDCIGFLSPMLSDVLNNIGGETDAIVEWRSIELNRESSYIVATDNWAKVYDKYNDVNRWIPTCAGTAGLKARCDREQNQWTSPAGIERGQYAWYSTMAWSATEARRDILYKNGVNSIVSERTVGFILFGDKTMTVRPSAFSRINVRSAFIFAGKSISQFAKQYLFEINDQYTRNQFLNATNAFLRDMTAQRAFSDFLVKCDTTNNTPQIVAQNRMVATILLKPTYSINYIDLNFIAVGPNMTFEEAIGTE